MVFIHLWWTSFVISFLLDLIIKPIFLVIELDIYQYTLILKVASKIFQATWHRHLYGVPRTLALFISLKWSLKSLLPSFHKLISWGLKINLHHMFFKDFMIICTTYYNFLFVPYIPSTLQLPHVFNVKIDESIMLVDVSSYMAQWKLIGKKKSSWSLYFSSL